MGAIQLVRKVWWDVPHPIHFVISAARDELSKSRTPRVRLVIKIPDLMSRLTRLARDRSSRHNQA